MKTFTNFLVFVGTNIKNIGLLFIGLIALFIFLQKPPAPNQAPTKKDLADKIYKSIPPHEQKMFRVITSTKSLYLANQDYNILTNIIKKAYTNNNQSAREEMLTNIKKGDLDGVEIYISPENSKVAVFTLKSNDCLAGLQSMQNNFIKLNIITNASNIQCLPDGYVIKSYPLR